VVVVNTSTSKAVLDTTIYYDPTVTGNGNIAVGDHRDRSTTFNLPDGPPGVGDMQATVTVDSTNAIFEYNTSGTGETNNSNTSAKVTSVLAPSPDLQVTVLSVTPSVGLQSGSAVTLSWDDANTGTGATHGSWYDAITVTNTSTNEVLASTTLLYDASAAGNGPIAAGDVRARQFVLTLPDGSRGAGQIQFSVTTDVYNQVFEFNTSGPNGTSTAESNNTSSQTVTSTLAPYPDLTVSSLILSPSSGLQTGNPLAIQWTDSNTGNGPVTGSFVDHVVIQNVTTGKTLGTQDVAYDPAAGGNGPIGAGQSRTRQLSFTLPQGTAGAGQIQVTLTTDNYNQVFEWNQAGTGGTSTAESNNTATQTVTAALAPYADLAASAVSAPSLTVGDPAQVTVSWTVTNQGTGPGTVGTWTDAVIVSPDNDPTHGTTIAQFTHQGLLAVGASYSQIQTFLLPPHFEGQYHLFVETNATKTVFENGNTANNFAEAPNLFDVTPIPYADLVVSSVTAPPSGASGQPIQVSWTVANQGIGVTNISTWNDDVSLATDPAGSHIVLDLGEFEHIGVLAPGGSYTHTVQAGLPDGLQGTYYVVVHTAGPYEFIYTNNNTNVGGPVTVTLTPPPDLTPTQIVGPTTAAAGDRVDVSWTVQNLGPGDANTPWTDSLMLNQVGGSQVYNLGQFSYTQSLQAGKSYTRDELVQLPSDVQGVFQFSVTTATGLFQNGATGNDTYVDPDLLTLTLPPNPDLQVSSVTAPAKANAGGTVSVAFTVINQGTVPTTTPHWTDSVYLSLNGTLDGSAISLGSFPNQSALMPGESYQTMTGDLLIPDRFAGAGYLIVKTDSGNAVDETPNEGNNTFVSPIYVNAFPPADLVTGGVTAPDQVFDGSTFTVSYTVTNKGLNVTDVPNWSDTIWLAHDPKRPGTSKGDVVLATLSHTGVLGNDPSVLSPPTSYTATTTVTLPKHITGQFYITAWADTFDQVLKSTLDVNINPDDPNELNNDNWKARPITVLLTPPPDLVVTSVTPQPTAVGGDSFTVNWTVANQGTSPTEDATLFDQVYLSDQPTFNAPGANQWFLGTVEHDGIVAAGGSYNAQATFALSPEISGKYVIVDTNTGNGTIPPTWEGPYANDNTNSGPALVTPLPPADLRVTSIVTQAPNYSGEKTTVQWTVTNFGNTVWSGTRYWVDQVYFSPYPTLNVNRDPLVGTVAYSNGQTLGSGQSYTQSQTFTLPRGIGGTAADPQTFYVYVITDPYGSTNTGSRDNDSSRGYYATNGYEDPTNNQSSQTIPVIYREPDLRVTNLVVPVTPVHSGDTIPVSWTVTNVGNRDTREGFWYDRVYLSTSPSLDDQSYMLGQLSYDSILPTGGHYDASLNVRIPDGIQGNFYILVFTDSNETGFPTIPGIFNDGSDPFLGRVGEYQGEGNNITAAFLPVILTIPPDLQVSSVTAVGPDLSQPDHVQTGQNYTVTYTVTNTGAGDTPDRQSQWNDWIFLSRDPNLDSGDAFLGEETHTGGLKAGQSYQIITSFKATRNLSGPWYVIVITDPPSGQNARGSVFEGVNEANNYRPTAIPLIFDVPPPSDLTVQTITIPSTALSGDPVEIQWTVQNIGAFAAAGSWTDSVYLSTDAIWDINDRLIGQVAFGGTVNPGSSYTSKLDTNLPAAAAGQYRVIVRTDIFDEVVESNELNNTTASANVMSVTVPELHLGVPVQTTLSTGQDRLYEVQVGLGQTLRVDLTSSDPSASNELYLRYQAVPTGSQYDAAYQGALQANQFAVIPSTHAGEYLVLVRGQSEPGASTPVTVVANVLPFEITDVIPDQGGDSKYVTTTILGAQFDPMAIVKLVRPGIAEYEPVSYQVVNSTKIIAIFDLTNAPHGLYDVEVINPNGQTAFAPYRYLVEQALAPDVSVALGGPRVLTAGAQALYGFSLESTTNVDIPYVDFVIGIPELDGITGPYPVAGQYRHLTLVTNLAAGTNPQVADVPWASLTPVVDTNGENAATAYVIDFADGSNLGESLLVQTYPDGVPPSAAQNPPSDTAFQFHIMAAATPLTTAEFIAQQTQEAATLRAAILLDPTASSSLQVLAADATSWTDLYLTALTQAGVLRAADVPPAVHLDPDVVTLTATLAAGILAGPAGQQIITTGNLTDFFNQVIAWYGNNPTLTSPYKGSRFVDNADEPGNVVAGFAPPASAFNLQQSSPTHFEAFNVYVNYSNDFDQDEDVDSSNPEIPGFVPVQPPNFSPFFNGVGSTGAAQLVGPYGSGSQDFVPTGQPLPYTVQFSNPSSTSTVGQIRIVSQLDPSLDPRSFRLGDLQIGDLEVHIPNTVGSFQGDFDFTQSKGFILRVSAGIDVHSGTITWLLQAIDPTTGEVEQDPTRGLLPPGSNASGFVTYTALPKAGLATGTQVSAQARVLFDTSAPQDTNTVTNTVDSVAPTTTLTATPISPGSSDYQVQWTATDDNGGSGVQGVTVYVAEDGGDYQIWLDQTTATSGIYNGRPGHTYQFLALATDNAGNHEQPPSGLSVPSDDSQANLGALPTVPGTTTDLGTPAQPSPQPSTNPLFTQAQQGIPSPVTASQPSEFQKILQPFTGRAFATGIAQSEANIGPVAIVSFPNGSALVSGGPARNQLFSFTAEGGPAETPLATEPFPIYDMALDTAGNLWATTGGGPLLELNPQTGAMIGQFGDSLTQSLAIQPGTGLIYVSSGKGIEIFDPTTRTFTHFSDLRVGSLAFAPDSSLWAATWPHNQNDIVEFVEDSVGPNPITPHYHPQLMLQLATDVDSIAFGLTGTTLAGLLFISHDEEARAGAGTELTMVDLATLQTVAIATGGSRGDEIKATPLGQILISQSHQVDILSPVQAPRVAGSNPPDGSTVGLPLGTISIIFDHDMYQGDPTDPRSVLDPANYQLIGDTAGPITIDSLVYDAASRTAVLTFDAIEAGGYTIRVGTSIQSTDDLGLAQPYSAHFQALQDLSSQVSISFFNGRANAANKTYSYSVTVTNNGPTPLLTPVDLTFDSLQPVNDQVLGATNLTANGTVWFNVSGDVPGGELFAGQATTVATVTFSNPSGLKLSFKTGVLALPAQSADPIFDSQPLTTATAGQLYNFPVAAHDPNRYALSYLLVRGPAGMTVNPTSGLVSWLPTVASPEQAPVVLQVYDSHGSRATLSYTITVGGVDLPPVLQPLPLQVTGQEGQSLQVALSATDPQGLSLISWADNLPPGAVYDTASETLSWVPSAGQAGTYPDIQFFVSDGVNQVSAATTLLIAPTLQPPTLVRPADRTVLEGESIYIPLQAADPNGDSINFSSAMLPSGAYLDPNTGVFDWTPAYFQHGVYQIPFTVSDGQLSVTKTTTFTVLNVNAPPQFDNLSSWRVAEGQDVTFRAFAFDPNNPGFLPQDRASDGTLTPLDGTNPTITYMASGLPAGAAFDPTTAIFDWPTGYSDAGNYVVTFTATNGGDGTGTPLSSTVSVPITILNTNRAPQINFIANQGVGDKAVLTLPVQAIDPDGDPMVLTAGGTTDQGLPAFASFVDNGAGAGTFTFAPGPDDAGNYTITLTATDNGDGGGRFAILSASQSFVLTVNNPNRPPRLAPIGDKVAVVGQELQFTIHATDGDQNPLTFSALGLPAGATLTPSSTYGDAVVTWTPALGDVGRSTVVFQVADNGNGNPADVLSDQRSINLIVRLTDQAPVLLPVGEQTVAQGQTLTVPLQATDPDGDSLLYSAANLPVGATFDPVAGVLTWTPNLFQSGTFNNIILSVSDGNLTASSTLTIDVTAINQAPVLVPLVEQDGREGTPLQFTLAAADPDGDTLTYSAISGLPAGAQFKTMTGQFNWTPTYDQAGDYKVRFGVSDPGGLTDQIDVTVHIDNVDRPPTLVVTNHGAVVGQPLTFMLLGSDPDQGTVLTYSALGMPAGASLNPRTGAFAWTPGPAQLGDYAVEFSVSDGELSATVPVVLRGTINPVPPQVIIVLTPSFPAVPGQSVIVHVAASSLAPITALSVTVAGQMLTLDSQGRATYTPQAPGRIAVSATATDCDGLVGQYATVLKVRDPNDQTAPTVAFDPRLANARLSATSPIVATIGDTNLDTWVLDRAPVGSTTFTTLATGTAPVSAGTLATFDPATVANGPYVLRLTATDIAGRTSQTTILVEADTTTKPTQYLRTETDLSVVLAGSVFNLVRSYDSLTAGQSGTFGYGWRLAIQDTDVQTTVLPTGHESTGIYNPFRIGTRVYLTLPTGQRVGFTFTPVKHQINGLTYFTPAYTADSGVTYTLTSAGGPLVQAGDRYYDLKTGLAYNPAADLYFGPEYTLTAPDGTIYHLSMASGVEDLVRPNGTRLVFGGSGITASTGESVEFVHDASGRITSISAPDGTQVIYTYDSAGNLVAARNLVAGQSSRYGYQAGPVHPLTEAVSPASGTSATVQYAPTLQVLPLTADLGSSGEFLASDRTGTLTAGGTDRYTFSLRPSELLSTPSGQIYLGISIQAASGSLLQPAVPSIAGLTPLVSRTSAHGAFALYLISTEGLERLDLSGANGATNGGYTLHMFVAGDVNGDGKVDGVDGQLLAGALGTAAGQTGYLVGADANLDGQINATDAQLLSSDLGFQANQAPVSTAGQALTHQGLAVSVDLATLATDPEDDPVYFRVLNPQDGSATLSPDGHTVTFVPTPGYTGLATFQYVADDGYGTSAPAIVSVTVSAAALVKLEFQNPSPLLAAGGSVTVVIIGDFADQTGVQLPPSYVNFSVSDTTVAQVSPAGVLTGVAEGGTALVISSHGLQAATGVQVLAPADLTNDLAVQTILDIYPGAVSLAVGLTRQLYVTDGVVDLTATSSGTQYFVSDPTIVSVDASGMATALRTGQVVITAINDGSEGSVSVSVDPVVSGPAVLGAAGGVVSGPDGSILQVPPGELPAGTTVGLTPVSQAALPAGYGVPTDLNFLGAERIDLGGNELNNPMQLSVPVAPGTPVGTQVFFYEQGSVPDQNGVEQPIWLQAEVGKVGSDGFAHTTSWPFPGLLDGGLLLIADPLVAMGLVYLDISAGSWAGTLYAVTGLDTSGVLYGADVTLAGILTDTTIPFFMREGSAESVHVVQPSPLGPPQINNLTLNVTSGTNQVQATVNPNFASGGRVLYSPTITGVQLNFPTPDRPQLVIDGTDFTSANTTTEVVFALGAIDPANPAVPDPNTPLTQPRDVRVTNFVSVSSTEITVDVPDTVPLGLASIFVGRRPINQNPRNTTNFKGAAGRALAATYLRSNQVVVPPPQNRLLAFVVSSSDLTVKVFDTGNSGDMRNATFLKSIQLTAPTGSFPFIRYVAATNDGTRAYVTSTVNGIAVIDAETLTQLDADPYLTNSTIAAATPAVDWIPFPGQEAQDIVIDPTDSYAFVADQSGASGVGSIYVLDIRPNSPTFDTFLPSHISIPGAIYGLRGLAITPDGNTLYATAPATGYDSLYGPDTQGQLVAVDIRDPDPTKWAVTGNSQNTGGSYPFGVTTAATNPGTPDRVLVANMVPDGKGLAAFSGGVSYTAMELGPVGDSFDVDNAQNVVFLPASESGRQTDYAFVTGYNIPAGPDLPSHDHGERYLSPYAAGSNIGIVADPFGNGKLVAATIPVPLGWPQGLALTPDGRYLYVSYVFGGGLRIYDVQKMLNLIESTPSNTLGIRAVDDLDPSIVQAFDVGELPRGIAIQNPRYVITTSGLQGDFIPVQIRNLLSSQSSVQNSSGISLQLTSFVGGQVALNDFDPLSLNQITEPFTYTLNGKTIHSRRLIAGVTAASLIANATPDDILQVRPGIPYDSPALPGTPAESTVSVLGTNFAQSGGFFFLPDLYTTGSFSIPVLQGSSTGTGRFTFRTSDGVLHFGEIVVTVNPAPEVVPGNYTDPTTGLITDQDAGLNFTLSQEAFRTIPYVVLKTSGNVAGTSGVTVSVGYDVGPQTANTVLSDFLQAGIPLQTALAYAAAVGQRGNASRNYYWTNESNLPALTTRQAEKLYRLAYQEHATTIPDSAQNLYENNVPNPKPTWANLDPLIKDVLIDMRYQGVLVASRDFPRFQTALQNNDPAAFRDDLLPYEPGGSFTPASLKDWMRPRFTARANFITNRLALRSQHLFAADSPTAGTVAGVGGPLTTVELGAIEQAAVDRWLAVDPSAATALNNVRFVLADLPAGDLGLETPASPNTPALVEIDTNAAGLGWFVDASPADDSEFTNTSFAGELLAPPGSPAFSRVDLLTVVEHELGHVLGLGDLDPSTHPHQLMTADLPTGVRRLPRSLGNGIPTFESNPILSGTGSDSHIIDRGALLATPTASLAAPSPSQALALAPTSSSIEPMEPASVTFMRQTPTVLYLGPGLDSTGPVLTTSTGMTTAVATVAINAPGALMGPIEANPPAQADERPRAGSLFERPWQRMSVFERGRRRDPEQYLPAQWPWSPTDVQTLPDDPIVPEAFGFSLRPAVESRSRKVDVRDAFLTALVDEDFIDRPHRVGVFGHAVGDEIARDVLAAREAMVQHPQNGPIATESIDNGRSPDSDRQLEAGSAFVRLAACLSGLVLGTWLGRIWTPQSVDKNETDEESAG